MNYLRQEDKILHYLSGYFLGLFALVVAYLVDVPYYLALSPVVVAAIGKEVYDHFHPESHMVEAADCVSTILGGASVVVPVVVATMLAAQ